MGRDRFLSSPVARVITSATEPMMIAAASDGADGQRFAGKKSAEQDGHDRVDIGVGRDLGRIAMAQQPDVSGVADDRADEHKINKRA